MSVLRFVASLALLVLAAFQFLALAVPLALLLAAPGALPPMVLAGRVLGGDTPLLAAADVAGSVLGGTAAALALWRVRRAGVPVGMLAGVLVAPLLAASALLLRGPGVEGLALSLAGFAAQGVAIGTICGLAGLRGIDVGVLRAAQMCRATPLGAIRRVLLAPMAPGVVAGGLLSATAAFGLGLVDTGRAGGLADIGSLAARPTTSIWVAGGLAVLAAVICAVSLALLRRR